MPLFMDIHRNVGASTEDLAAAHRSDLEVQEKYGARYLKYWFNQAAQTVCCLVEAPDAESASKVHAEAHGLVAEKLIEVERAVVEAFLGDSDQVPLLAFFLFNNFTRCSTAGPWAGNRPHH